MKPPCLRASEEGANYVALRHDLTIILQDSDFERVRQVRELSCTSWL
jgi:hypothetical protein